AFMNSFRATTKGLARAPSADGAAPAPSDPAPERPRCASMKRGSHIATRSPMRRMARSPQRAERVGNAEARVAREARGHDLRDPDGEDGEDDGAAHHLKHRARGAEEGARLDERDPSAGDLAPEPDDQVEEEDLDPDAEGVGDEILGERGGAAEGGEAEEQHLPAQDHVALYHDDHQ